MSLEVHCISSYSLLTNALIAVVGLQWGSNGPPMGEMGENNLGDLLYFSFFLIVFVGL